MNAAGSAPGRTAPCVTATTLELREYNAYTIHMPQCNGLWCKPTGTPQQRTLCSTLFAPPSSLSPSPSCSSRASGAVGLAAEAAAPQQQWRAARPGQSSLGREDTASPVYPAVHPPPPHPPAPPGACLLSAGTRWRAPCCYHTQPALRCHTVPSQAQKGGVHLPASPPLEVERLPAAAGALSCWTRRPAREPVGARPLQSSVPLPPAAGAPRAPVERARTSESARP